MTQKFLTSLAHPFALVRFGPQTPGKRIGTSMAWLSHKNPDGTYSGCEIKPKAGTGVWRNGMFTIPRWVFTYKHPKQFAPENIVHRFGHGVGQAVIVGDNTVRMGGPSRIVIDKIKRQLPKVPGYDEVERPAVEGSP